MEYSSPFETEQKSQFDSFELQLTSQSQSFLRETAKWATFLSVLGFIWIGLMILFSIFFIAVGGEMSRSRIGAAEPFPITFVGVFYLLMAVLTFFPILYLNKFAGKMKSALNSNRTDLLTDSFQNLKSHYKFVGILAIIGIAVFILFIIFAVIAGIAATAGAF